MSLLEQIQRGMTQAPDTKVTGGKARAEAILREKGGKARAATGPRKGGMQERVVAAQAASAVAQQKQKGELAAVELKQQEEKIVQTFDNKQREQYQGMKQAQTQLNMKLESLLAGARREERELDLRKDASNLEQAAFAMRLSNEKYVNNLTIIGQESRLDDTIEFKEQATKMMLGENLSARMDKLGWQGLQNAAQREREVVLARMDINQATELANAALKDYNNQQMWEGVTGLIKGGASAYASGGGFGGESFDSIPDAGPVASTAPAASSSASSSSFATGGSNPFSVTGQ